MTDNRFEVDPDVVATEFDGKDTVVLNLATKRYYTLNETATLIWSGLEKGLSESGIIELLTGRYEVSAEHARASISTTLASLQAQQLIRPCQPRS